MEASKRFRLKYNVTLRVLDKATGKLIKEHIGHNSATNTLIEGVGHYLAGEGVLRQGYSMLSQFVPQYISLGTMGLHDQNEDSSGLPTGLSGKDYTGDEATDLTNYINERPGYGSDGYSWDYNNGRPYLGLGPAYTSFSTQQSYHKGDITYYKGVAYEAKEDMIVDPDLGIYNYWNSDGWKVADSSKQPTCYELITPDFPRVEISFRDVVPEYESEKAKTVDVIYSAMISTGALAQFRDPSKDYLFITESGLWCQQDYQPDNTGVNGLVAGYRVVPPNYANWFMSAEDVPDILAYNYWEERGVTNPTSSQITQAKNILSTENRQILKEQVLRVERDQVVQVIWKIQIGNIDMGDGETYMSYIPGDIQSQITELYNLIGTKVLYAENASIPTSRWTSSSRTDYPYTARITVPGLDSSYFAMVEFDDNDSMSGNFATITRSSTDSIYIYAMQKPSTSIVIPLIVCYKGTQVNAS